MSSPSSAERVLSPALLLKLAVAAALSLAVVELAPRSVEVTGDVPPVAMLLVTAVLVAAFCTTALIIGLRFDLGLPWNAVLYTVGFNLLVVFVKLALAPHAFYEVNQTRTVDSTFAIDNEFMATFAAGFVFVLYLLAYLFLYRFFHRRIEHLREIDPIANVARGRNLVIAIIVLTLLLTGAGGALVIVLLPVVGGLNYLDFVFSSSLSLLVGLALAGATALAALAFDSVSMRARVAADASLLVSFFWVGLFFLALYHVLWVVYVLILTSIWPLKVVTPK